MATINKRGNAWVLNWREGGRQHRKSLGAVTHSEAKRALAIKEAELATGIQIFSSAPHFGDYADEYLEWFKHEFPSSYNRTEQIVRNHLKPFFEVYALDQIEPRIVEQYKVQRLNARKIYAENKPPKDGRSPEPIKAETVRKELRTFKAMLNRAVDWGVIDRHPCPNVKAPKNTDSKPPRYYTAKELEAIYVASLGEKRWIWQLLANTGLRRGEALMLRKDWDLGDRLRILSEGEARTKSGKWREVPIGPGAREALDQLGETAGYVLPRMTPRSLTRAFERCLNRAPLDGSLHCLRHTFCSHLVMNGVPLRTVQILAGHSTFAVTEKYAHLAPDHLANALGNLHL